MDDTAASGNRRPRGSHRHGWQNGEWRVPSRPCTQVLLRQ